MNLCLFPGGHECLRAVIGCRFTLWDRPGSGGGSVLTKKRWDTNTSAQISLCVRNVDLKVSLVWITKRHHLNRQKPAMLDIPCLKRVCVCAENISSEEEYKIACLLMVFVAVSLPTLASNVMSQYSPAIEGEPGPPPPTQNLKRSYFIFSFKSGYLFSSHKFNHIVILIMFAF